jgi:hypothetical protein
LKVLNSPDGRENPFVDKGFIKPLSTKDWNESGTTVLENIKNLCYLLKKM